MVPIIKETQDKLKSTIPLTATPLFQPRYGCTREETFRLSYERAVAINKHYGLWSVQRIRKTVLSTFQGLR